jgi:hypothetical protein
MPQDTPADVKCPLCGAVAETGAIYANDRSDLSWIPGEPSWTKNVKAAWGASERVGEYPSWAGTHVRGIFCRSCNRIVIDVPKPVNYYPDVRG